ncbi:MAG: DUF4157 domain-containing protein [Kineosporiaceae bacterium]|nr:DUF4157 domain-containing protein [Kineosporiaceae bacterium]
MRGHQHDLDSGDSLRPKAARLDEENPLAARAAATGQWGAIGAAGLAGLQRSVGNAGIAAALDQEERSPVHDVISSGGRPLDEDVRTDMESRLGADFSDVRVHDDSAAHDSARAVNAHAYTVGSNVVFQRDQYDPSSTQGRTTLAHELTHVVQQRSGPVDGTPAAGGVRISDPSDRFEREAADTAARVMSDPAPAAAPSSLSAAAGPSAAVQRDESEESEDSVQGLFVQRQEDEEQQEDVQGSFAGPPPVQRDESEDDEQPEG